MWCASGKLVVRCGQSNKAGELREIRDAAIMQNREDRRILFLTKLENAERMRRVKEMKKREMLDSMQLTDARLQHAKVHQCGWSVGG